MLTDAQWAELAPLVERCRPHAKVPRPTCGGPSSAILWRHENGAKWRSPSRRARPVVDGGADLHPLVAPRRLGAPAGPGPGARRPARHDLPRWHQRPRPPEGGGRCGQGGAQARRGAGEALGRSRGGYGTKACVIADGAGRAIAFRLAPGRRTSSRRPCPCSTPAGRAALCSHHPSTPPLDRRRPWLCQPRLPRPCPGPGRAARHPAKRNEAPVACPAWIYTTATASSACGPG